MRWRETSSGRSRPGSGRFSLGRRAPSVERREWAGRRSQKADKLAGPDFEFSVLERLMNSYNKSMKRMLDMLALGKSLKSRKNYSGSNRKGIDMVSCSAKAFLSVATDG